jgi:hypothetical protein
VRFVRTFLLKILKGSLGSFKTVRSVVSQKLEIFEIHKGIYWRYET